MNTEALDALQRCAEIIEYSPLEGIDAMLENHAWSLWELVGLGDLTEEMIRVKLVSAVDGRVPADLCHQQVSRGFLRAQGKDPDHLAWGKPEPLPKSGCYAPALDPALLPDSIRGWLVESAELASMPLEFAAMPAMVALGAVVGRRVGICPERYEDTWIVPCNLWGAIVGDSGQRKTAGARIGMEFLSPIERGLREEWEANGPDYDAKRISLERQAKGGRGKDVDEHEIAEAIRQLKKLPTGARRVKTNDATTEKLAMMLADNPDGILIVRDELSGWMKLMDKTGRENDRSFYLEGWNGDGSHSIDRVGRGSLYVPIVSFSVFGTLQPGPLAEYMAGAMAGGSKADGMIQRFQLLAWPDDRPKYKQQEKARDARQALRAEGTYLRLHKSSAATLGGKELYPGAKVPAMRFTHDAQAIYERWHAEIEDRLASTEFDGRAALASHISKYRSLMPKLSLVLHLADHNDGSAVSDQSAAKAVFWVQWLEKHARKAYADEEPQSMRGARALAEKIRNGQIVDKATVRDVYTAHWGELNSRARVDLALTELKRLGWLRTVTKATSGRPRTEIEINPAISW